MRGRVTIVISIALLLLLLVLLNAASYVRVEEESDSEFAPDRSTLNAGRTGTRALYEFLQESGHKVYRWRKSPVALLGKEPVAPSTFVLIGELRQEFGRGEHESLLRWVAGGGRLVVIDRSPDISLLPGSGRWRVLSEITQLPGFDIQPEDAGALTEGVKTLHPAQPTLFTRDVEKIQPSRYASRLRIIALDEKEAATSAEGASGKAAGKQPDDETHDRANETTGEARKEEASDGTNDETAEDETAAGETDAPPTVWPWATPTPAGVEADDDSTAREPQGSPAPVSHVRMDAPGASGALVVDYAYRRGRIVVLGDPFVVSNSGIGLADNLQLAVNILDAGRDGVIAFDEYHQGRGLTQNMTLAYFKGTPVLAMFAQVAVMILAVMWTRSRRFARPLPAPHTDRRSNLEFVASMAELQQRARAYDLALENVYSRTRRALARYGGTTADAAHTEIAARIAARSGRDPRPLAALMRECEDAIAGEPVTPRRALRLAAALRETERELGIRMRAREIRQTRSL